MDLTEFNQRKKLVEDTINDNARRMKESLDLFPDSERKTEWQEWIEDGRKENLRRFKKLNTL
jgi:hypothetical protein